MIRHVIEISVLTQKSINMKKILKVALLPFLVSVLAALLFLLVAIIPQEAIQKNAESTVKQLLSHHQWEIALNKGDPTYTFDLYTDSIIMMESYNLNTEDISSIFKNPMHTSEANEWNAAMAMDEVVNGDAQNERSYTRYWMGFRMIVRPLLLIADYYTIRKIVSAVFFILFALTTALIAKKKGIKIAFCFAVPIALMNPAIISHSLQFSCDFILAFIFIVFLLITDGKKFSVPVMFCAFGVLTQLFDFYTTPLITYALPLIVLLTLEEYENKRWSTALVSFATWMYGYASMWVVKMLFTTLFTDKNGFKEAFNSFAGRVGITKPAGLEEKYDSVEALRLVYNNIFVDTTGNIIFLAIAIVSVTAVIISFLTNKRKDFFSQTVFIFIAVLPLLWFAVAAQPTVIHYWFQYRTVVATFASLFVYWVCAYSKVPRLIKRK